MLDDCQFGLLVDVGDFDVLFMYLCFVIFDEMNVLLLCMLVEFVVVYQQCVCEVGLDDIDWQMQYVLLVFYISGVGVEYLVVKVLMQNLFDFLVGYFDVLQVMFEEVWEVGLFFWENEYVV